jgi:hypothetical protein
LYIIMCCVNIFFSPNDSNAEDSPDAVCSQLAAG